MRKVAKTHRGINAEMGMSFTYKTQWIVSEYCSRGTMDLTAGELRVLLRLLERGNPKTGQCNPSISSLSRDTGFSNTTVKNAIKSLKARGIISFRRKSRYKSYEYEVFLPPYGDEGQDDIENDTLCDDEDNRACGREQPGFRSQGNRAFPKIIKEIKKEIYGPKNSHAVANFPRATKRKRRDKGEPRSRLSMQKMENAVAEALDANGYGREVLYALETSVVGAIYDEFRQRVIEKEQAKRKLMEACEAHINRDLGQ